MEKACGEGEALGIKRGKNNKQVGSIRHIRVIWDHRGGGRVYRKEKNIGKVGHTWISAPSLQPVTR